MHPNPVFHDAEREENLTFARSRGFGMLTMAQCKQADEAPLVSHVPFLLSQDGSYAELHLVRSNPIARQLQTPRQARIAVAGPDGYVSPDWYGIANQVPTWNYIAVHLVGKLELRPQAELRDLIDRQSTFFEEQLTPKPVWTTAKMEGEALDRMMRMIVPVRLHIQKVEGTWKLSQNKEEQARYGAAEGVVSGIGSELKTLSQLMYAQRS